MARRFDQHHLAGIAMQGKTQKELEQMRIDAGKYDKSKQISDVAFLFSQIW